MLLKVSPAALPVSLKFRLPTVSESSTICCCFSSQFVRYGGKRRVVAVGAGNENGYTKRSLETPGAYQLIDNKTGNKVIVWGGTDDDDESSIPSNEILHWEPTNNSDSSSAAANTKPAGLFIFSHYFILLLPPFQIKFLL